MMSEAIAINSIFIRVKSMLLPSLHYSNSSTSIFTLATRFARYVLHTQNWGGLISLARFDKQIVKTDKQPRRSNDEHSKAAWLKNFEYDEVFAAEKALVRTIFNRDGRKCWGFKEIRYGMKDHLVIPSLLAEDIAFLESMVSEGEGAEGRRVENSVFALLQSKHFSIALTSSLLSSALC